jgi:hypothetical protein
LLTSLRQGKNALGIYIYGQFSPTTSTICTIRRYITKVQLIYGAQSPARNPRAFCAIMITMIISNNTIQNHGLYNLVNMYVSNQQISSPELNLWPNAKFGKITDLPRLVKCKA